RFWKEENLPGGAGNTAANVRALGGVPVPVGATGADEAGRALREALRRAGIATDGLEEIAGHRRPTKARLLGGAPHGIKQQVARYDIEDALPPDAADAPEKTARLAAAAAGAQGAILSDYGYGAVSPTAVPALRAALPAGARICVD